MWCNNGFRWRINILQELAEYCKSIDIDCDKCEHKKECEDFQDRIEEISPFGMVEMVDNDVDVNYSVI